MIRPLPTREIVPPLAAIPVNFEQKLRVDLFETGEQLRVQRVWANVVNPDGAAWVVLEPLAIPVAILDLLIEALEGAPAPLRHPTQ